MISTLRPVLNVEPGEIDFGNACLGEPNVRKLQLFNVGTGILTIDDITVESTTDELRVENTVDRIGPGQSAEIDVVFTPQASGVLVSGTLRIVSNDADSPQLDLSLRGVGGGKRIEVEPSEVDFGVVNEGTAARRSVIIRNVGGETLRVDRVEWISDSLDMAPTQGSFTGGDLACGQSAAFDIEYSPVDIGGDSGLVVVTSSEADRPRTEVSVSGEANLAPRAIAFVCDIVADQVGCPADDRRKRHTAQVDQRRGLDGRESYDPEGGDIQEYRWEVVEPLGSETLRFFFAQADRDNRRATGDVTAALPGKYKVRLIVKDENGLESPNTGDDEIRLAPKDLEVLMRWDVATDVDLHFVRPDGLVGDYGAPGQGARTGSDCSTFNRSPDWGLIGDRDDDPRLDIDVVRSTGPEIVSLDLPERDGAYRVYSHYCDSQQVGAATSVTFVIYVEGEPVQTIPEEGGFTLEPGELWEAAQIRWLQDDPPMAEIVEVEGEPTLRPELCNFR